MAKVVILGAGLTGLSSAYHLEQHNFFDYKIFEREQKPGGLCKSVKKDGFTFDYTGHLLHISDPYFKSFLDNTVGLENFNILQRRSFIFSKDIFTNYPFQTNLHGLPPKIITECIEGFLNRKKSLRKPKNFHEWVLKHFGHGIGKHFLFSYQSKLLSYDIKKISDNWTGRFVPATNLRTMIEGAITRSEEKIGYNSSFIYPKKGGVNTLPLNIEQKIKTKVYTGYNVVNIDLKNKLINFENGHVEKYETLITTLPLDVLLKKSSGLSKINFNNVIPKLLCNSVMNFNLGINIPDLTDKHWIYFPERKYQFYRIGFWKNFSQDLVKDGHSSLYGEFSYLPQKTTSRQVENLIQQSIKQTVKVLGIKESNLVTQQNLLLKHAYVIYDNWRDRNLNKIHKRLNEESVYSVGRFGEWKYSSMQEAILDGKKVASSVITSKSSAFYGAVKVVEQPILPGNKEKEVRVR